jgi:hypothetical protein
MLTASGNMELATLIISALSAIAAILAAFLAYRQTQLSLFPSFDIVHADPGSAIPGFKSAELKVKYATGNIDPNRLIVLSPENVVLCTKQGIENKGWSSVMVHKDRPTCRVWYKSASSEPIRFALDYSPQQRGAGFLYRIVLQWTGAVATLYPS